MDKKADQLPTAPLIERFQGGIRANADPRMLAERLLRASELALEAARSDTADAMLACEELSERILALEDELAEARREPERLQGLLSAEQRARRVAEQQAYAEQARREELQDELTTEREGDQADPVRDEVTRADERRRELELEAAALRRRADELAHLVSTARYGRERAERRVAELTVALDEALANHPASPVRSDGLVQEFATAATPIPFSPPVLLGPAPPGSDPLLALERRLVRARSDGATRSFRAGDADAQSAHAEAPADADAASALAEMRSELATLGADAHRERAARLSVEARAARLERELSEQIRRSSRAYDAIEELRKRLGAIGGWGPSSPETEPDVPARDAVSEPESTFAPAVAVEAERFTEALARLREAMPPESQPTDPGPPTDPAPSPGPALASSPEPLLASAPQSPEGSTVAWLPGAFRRLARENPAGAGQLVLELLPAQRAVHPEPIAYDLDLPGGTCIQLTVTDEGMTLELGDRRPASEVGFAVIGDTASLARLLAAGRIGRRLRRGMPKVTGERRGLQALDALVGAPLTLRQLHDAGVRLEPRLALEVVARMIDPSWTRGSRFSIGYRAPGGVPVIYLEVRGGESVKVSAADEPDRMIGTIAGESESLLALLDGREAHGAEFQGDRAQLAEVIGWVKRAQSG